MKILLFSMILVFANNSYACLCDEFHSEEELIEAQQYIIQGTVISVNSVTHYDTVVVDHTDSLALYYADENGLQIHSETAIEIKIKIDRVFKGSIDSEIVIVYTESEGSMCGDRRFRQDTQYFVYGYSRNYPGVIQNANNTFWTSICSGNRRYSDKHLHVLDNYFR